MALASAPTSARLVVINILGGLDGLAAVAPYGDPNLAKLRAALMSGPVGADGGMLYLGGFFGLHPKMTNLHAMFAANEALMVHAVGNSASTRSHFEGQDYLQSGAPALLTSGWLNRVIGLMPAAPSTGVETGISMSSSAPLLIRGPSAVAGWSPDLYGAPSATMAPRLVALTRADPLIGPALAIATKDTAIFKQVLSQSPAITPGLPPLVQLATAAGEMLAAANGPRVAALETASLDTHTDQINRLDVGLSQLDAALQALKTSLGAAWSNTVVLTMTEFGRAAYANGVSSGGTDHGTAFAVFLAGGAVTGGKVVTTWPGLGSSQLFQGRDLAPTVDFRSIAMGVLRDHLGIAASSMPVIFPGAGSVSPMSGLVRLQV